jgi:hypothetical protein
MSRGGVHPTLLLLGKPDQSIVASSWCLTLSPNRFLPVAFRLLQECERRDGPRCSCGATDPPTDDASREAYNKLDSGVDQQEVIWCQLVHHVRYGVDMWHFQRKM